MLLLLFLVVVVVVEGESEIRLVRRGLLLMMARDEMGRMMGRVKSDARSVGRRMVGGWLLWIEGRGGGFSSFFRDSAAGFVKRVDG